MYKMSHETEIYKNALAWFDDEATPSAEQVKELVHNYGMLLNVYKHMLNQRDDVMSKARKEGEIDPLTQVYNRRYLDKMLEGIFDSFKCMDKPVSILMIDVDYFKKYNDSCGHGAGDDCLKKVAQALSCCLQGKEGFVARYGGEEFAAILSNSCVESARKIAEKMLIEVRQLNINHPDSEVAAIVTVSVGGCTASKLGVLENPGSYQKNADKALYQAKNNGRNRYVAFK